MANLLATLLAALPKAVLFMFSKLVTESFLQAVVQKVTIYALETLVPLTTNTLDDELLDLVKRRLAGEPLTPELPVPPEPPVLNKQPRLRVPQ